MKIDKFAVSIQWGSGYHYFMGYYSDEAQAQSAADEAVEGIKKDRAKKKGSKGATPHGFIWEMKSQTT